MSGVVLASIFNFGVVAFILYYFGKKPFLNFLATRSETVGAQIVEATQLSESAAIELKKW